MLIFDQSQIFWYDGGWGYTCVMGVHVHVWGEVHTHVWWGTLCGYYGIMYMTYRYIWIHMDTTPPPCTPLHFTPPLVPTHLHFRLFPAQNYSLAGGQPKCCICTSTMDVFQCRGILLDKMPGNLPQLPFQGDDLLITSLYLFIPGPSLPCDAQSSPFDAQSSTYLHIALCTTNKPSSHIIIIHTHHPPTHHRLNSMCTLPTAAFSTSTALQACGVPKQWPM